MPAHARDPVRITIEGHGYGGVPEQVLDQFRVDATPQEQGCAGVPEVVPADRGEACAVEERLEVAVHHVLGVQRRALRVAKTRLESS